MRLRAALSFGLFLAFRPSGFHLPAWYVVVFILGESVIGVGACFIERCRFRFRMDARVVEVTTIWLLVARRSETLPFADVRSIELINPGRESPLSVRINAAAGKHWTVRYGSKQKMRKLAGDVADLIGKSNTDGTHWT